MNRTYRVVSWPFKACLWIMATVTFVVVYALMLAFLPLAVAVNLALSDDFDDFVESMRSAYVDLPLDYIREML